MATKKSDNLTKVTRYLVDDSVLGGVTQVCAYVAITPFKNKSFEIPWALFLSI